MNIELQLEKARIYAYATFLGLMSPVIGVVAYFISTSITDRLEVDTDEQLAEANRIESMARKGLVVSLLLIVLGFALFAFYFNAVTSFGNAR